MAFALRDAFESVASRSSWRERSPLGPNPVGRPTALLCRHDSNRPKDAAHDEDPQANQRARMHETSWPRSTAAIPLMTVALLRDHIQRVYWYTKYMVNARRAPMALKFPADAQIK